MFIISIEKQAFFILFLSTFKLTVKNIQPRLRHCTINFNDQLIIFGGSSGYNPTSGTYNDVWKFDQISVSLQIPKLSNFS